jgi:ankyrin repeat protein
MRLSIASLFLAACQAAVPPAQFSSLADAARNGDTAAIRRLVADGADPNAPSGGNGWTPLLHAIHKHQNASVAALIDAGADVNRPDAKRLTPLMMAAGYGYDDTVQLLLSRHADPTIRDLDGGTALDWAMTGMTDIDRWTFFTCQDSTTRLLHDAAPSLQPQQPARRFVWIKRCQVSS